MRFPIPLGIAWDDCKRIPDNWASGEYREVLFTGWTKMVMTADNETFSDLMTLASKTLSCMIHLYKDKFAFSEPVMTIKPNGDCTIGIWMLDLERYEKIKESHDKKE